MFYYFVFVFINPFCKYRAKVQEMLWGVKEWGEVKEWRGCETCMA